MQPLGIGHVVLKVRDLDRSLAFYRDLLGFRVVSEMSNVMIFLTATGESHHDLALLRVGQQAPSPLPTAVGLYHVAIHLADWEAVRAAWETIFANTEFLMTVHPTSGETIPVNIDYIRLPMHPGAIRYFQERGVKLRPEHFPPEMPR